MQAEMTPWWGEQPTDRPRRVCVGPLAMWLVPGPGDVRISWKQGVDPLAPHSDVADCDGPEGVPDDVIRVAGNGPVTLRPALANRPVVVRPEVPLVLAPASEARVYVSTPLWVQVFAGKALLADVPSFRPSDTWYGPNTRTGSLCYGSRTAARLDADNLPRRPGRAVTELRIANHGKQPLTLDRLRVPVPALGLHFDGHLLTDPLRVDADDDEVAKVVVDRRPDPLTPPRRHDTEGMLVRALQMVRGG